MLIKIFFRYCDEIYSFYNKAIIRFGIFAFLFILILGFQQKDLTTMFVIIGIEILIYSKFAINTLRIYNKYKRFKLNGKKVDGKIVNFLIKKGKYDYKTDTRSYFYYLEVEYENPLTGVIETVRTNQVNGSPYTYLSSLDVNVYIIGKEVLVTDFKRIKTLSDRIEKKLRKEDIRTTYI